MRSIKWHGRDDLRPTRSHAMHCFAVDDDPGDQISQTWSRGCFRKLARIFIHALARDLKTKVIQLAVVCKMYDFFFFWISSLNDENSRNSNISSSNSNVPSSIKWKKKKNLKSSLQEENFNHQDKIVSIWLNMKNNFQLFYIRSNFYNFRLSRSIRDDSRESRVDCRK